MKKKSQNKMISLFKIHMIISYVSAQRSERAKLMGVGVGVGVGGVSVTQQC